MLKSTLLRRDRKFILACLCAGACLLGCQAAPETPDDSDPPGMETPDDTVSFAADVQPIFDRRCGGCHSAGGMADQAGIALRLTPNVSHGLLVNQASVQDGDWMLVEPGNAAASLLFVKITSASPPVGSRMPLFQPAMPQSEIDIIRDWIDQGALDN